MLTVSFFLYNFISLYISSSISIKLKDVKNVEKISYINNIALLLIVAVLAMSISSSLAIRYACEVPSARVNYNLYSIITISFLNLVLNASYIAMVSNEEFKNVPQDVQRMVIVALVLNIIGTIGGISMAVYGARHRISQ